MKIFTELLLNKNKEKLGSIISLFIWILIWQILTLILNQEMILPSPFSVGKEMIYILGKDNFRVSILNTTGKLFFGFFSALIVGTVLAVISYKYKFMEIFMKPFIATIKSAPVASYIVLCLIIFKSSSLSIIISFLMVFPIIYINILKGLQSVDTKLIEMATVFQIGFWKKIIYIYFLNISPFFLSACSIAWGVCWKSGLAAELIGLPKDSIGEKLYNTKIYFDMPSLFAWTIIIIIISVILEKILLLSLKRMILYVERA